MMVPRATEAVNEHHNSRRKEKAFVIWALTSSNFFCTCIALQQMPSALHSPSVKASAMAATPNAPLRHNSGAIYRF